MACNENFPKVLHSDGQYTYVISVLSNKYESHLSLSQSILSTCCAVLGCAHGYTQQREYSQNRS